MSDELWSEVRIGGHVDDHITIRVLGRAYPDADDFGDGNWLSTFIDFAVGQFRGTVAASLRADEFRSFHRALKELDASLRGEALLESMEEWISLRIAVTSSGRLEIAGRLTDRPGSGNQLMFEIGGLDQSYLPAILTDLEGLLARYPVLDEAGG
jgi:hypothetical protein